MRSKGRSTRICKCVFVGGGGGGGEIERGKFALEEGGGGIQSYALPRIIRSDDIPVVFCSLSSNSWTARVFVCE